MISQWQQEQRAAVRMVQACCSRLTDAALNELRTMTASYMAFRKDLENFLQHRFGRICTRQCWENKVSACCSKDGIIAFFADVVINHLHSTPQQIHRLAGALDRPNPGLKCACLGDGGCLWHIRPVVCAMFLCDRAERAVFEKDPAAEAEWQALTVRKKRFTWPDRPVLFDDIEAFFLADGVTSPLMYCHNSPGLLRVKKERSIDRP